MPQRHCLRFRKNVLDSPDKLSNIDAMSQQHLSWQTVSDVAAALGAKEHARRKWQSRRSIPAKWQIAICKQFGGEVSLEQLAAIWQPAPKEAAE